jgi:acetaldehyde dehydrogenase (acetylating)
VINSPTTHGAIGFSTDLPPSMTLGCGSWGGNVTSDNVSPIHLMDVKRVAFETKAVKSRESRVESKPKISNLKFQSETQKPKREEIAAIVDRFLSQKLAETPQRVESRESGVESQNEEIANRQSQIENQTDSPVKTIIHELKPQSAVNGAKPVPVDFVSEDDVRQAVNKGEKIYITAKTIITPSAKDLGEEKEIFAKV